MVLLRGILSLLHSSLYTACSFNHPATLRAISLEGHIPPSTAIVQPDPSKLQPRDEGNPPRPARPLSRNRAQLHQVLSVSQSQWSRPALDEENARVVLGKQSSRSAVPSRWDNSTHTQESTINAASCMSTKLLFEFPSFVHNMHFSKLPP